MRDTDIPGTEIIKYYNLFFCSDFVSPRGEYYIGIIL